MSIRAMCWGNGPGRKHLAHVRSTRASPASWVGDVTSPLTEAEVDASSIACTRRKTAQSRRWSSSGTSRCASSMGPFANFQRSVEEIDDDHSRLRFL